MSIIMILGTNSEQLRIALNIMSRGQQVHAGFGDGKHESEWLDKLMELVNEDKENYIFTMNPHVVDHVDIDNPIRQFRFVREHPTNLNELIFVHMSNKEADHFLKSINAGYQYSSEILRSMRLW